MDRDSDVGSSEPGSGRDTPRSLDQDAYRSDTPGTMPTYRYSKDKLYDLENAAASLIIPDCLDREFIVDGIWDPEKWFRSFGGGSRGPSPLTAADARERRSETSRRHSASERLLDPKERLKEENDDIILSPQRRSFGTGCHVVTHQPLLQRAISNIVDDRDRDRRETRRIGSGRIQIDRDRGERDTARGGERDFRTERDRVPERDFRIERGSERDSRDRDFRNDRVPERENRDFRDRNDRVPEREREGDPRDFRNVREIERSRDRGDRDFHSSRDRFERDDRDRDRRYERDRMFISRRNVEDRPRNFRDFSNRHNNRRDRHDSRHEEEPEWFSSGPISKNDTIELHGFERERARRDSERIEEDREREVNREKVEMMEEDEDSEGEEKTDSGGIGVADRNGSLETNESSSPETNQSDLDIRPAKTPPANTLFDFNEFFNIENIPGLSDDPVADPELTSIGGSRFYQLYRMTAAGANQSGPGSRGSRENSRRSSVIEDEFGYLNDLMNGSRSPVIPSPPPPSATFDRSGFLSPFATSDKQQHIEFGTVGQKLNTNNPLVTALINNASVIDRSRGSPSRMKSSPQETEARLKALLFGRIDSTSSSGNTTPGFNSPLNVPGKVKTLAELEGELQPNAGRQNQQAAMRRMTPPNVQRRSSPQQEGNDLSAFNKLISLMQAGAARPVESPKLPIKTEPRPASPLVNIPSHLQQNQSTLTHQQTLPHQQAPPHQQQAPPIQQIPPLQQANMMQKLEPTPIHGQNTRADLQFGPVDSFPGMISTPTSVAPPSQQNQDLLSEANAAQKQFLQAIQRNKEQQLQIRQAAIQNMRYQQAPPPGQSGPTQSTPVAGSMQQPPPSQQTPAQQQQSGMPRRPSTGDPIMNFLKANPTIVTKPASPTPPPQQGAPPAPILNLTQHGSTPRGPSPSPVIQQTQLLTQQPPPGSPRVVPSPIMFSQQPPMHLNAPSPIHPSQGGGSLAQSPTSQQQTSTNTSNTIRPPSVPRVPSPQELIAHTQAILQNALIKKQLEDQKERFYKKQQERDKSPNPLLGKLEGMGPGLTPAMMAGIVVPGAVLPNTSTPISSGVVPTTPASTKSAVNVAFTPTSVIRKMHSEKANEKEKQRRDSLDYELQDKQVRPDVTERVPSTTDADIYTGSSRHDQPPTSIPPPTMVHAIPHPQHLSNQVLPNMLSVMPPGTMIPGMPPPPFHTNQMTHLPPPPSHVSTHLPPPLLSPGAPMAPPPGPPPPHHPPTSLVTQEQIEAAKSQQLRALIGQQAPVQHVPLQVVTTALPNAGRPIVKGNVVSTPQPMVQPGNINNMSKDVAMQQHRQLIGSTNTPTVSAVDMAKVLQRQYSTSPNVIARTPTTPNTPYGMPLTGRMPLQSTPVVGPQPPTPGTNPILMQQMIQGANPRAINQLTQLATLQAQQRMLDPRGVRPQIPGSVVQQILNQHNVSSIQTSIHNPASFNSRPLNPLNTHKNGPMSPASHIPVSLVTNGNNNFMKQDNVNLMKWFGTDMLKTQLPTMPPLPVTGQKVLTLDEIERS